METDDTKPRDPTVHLIGHRFGEPGGADPKAARAAGNPPWSVRRAMRLIAAHKFEADLDDPKAVLKEIKKIFGKNLDGAAILAVTRFAQAMKNYKAMQNVVEDIDGKLVEKKLEATVDYAQLVNASLQEDDTIVTGRVGEGQE